MANIMSMVKLRNHTSRNGFDLSKRNAFTAKVGELLPVNVIEVIPGDKVKGRVQHFTRTQPVNTAAYTRIREYYDWYFVPTNLLWNKFNSFVTQMTSNTQHAASITTEQAIPTTHPYFTYSQLAAYINSMQSLSGNSKFNMFGFSRPELTCKLLSYLGYGKFDTALGTSSGFYNENVNLNPFPLLAYQKIYQDYYRDSQWESSSASSYNVDYLTGQTSGGPQIPTSQLYSNDSIASIYNMFDLRYANWNKDLFMGLLPQSQYGDAASIVLNSSLVDIDSSLQLGNIYIRSGSTTNPQTPQLISSPNAPYGEGVGSSYKFTLAGASSADLQHYLSVDQLKKLKSKLGLDAVSGNFSILALRQAEALQKWREITQSQQQDYKSQVEAHFGVSMSNAYSERCLYVGGSVSNLDISEVTNTNITGSNASNIAGKGVGVGDGSFDFSSDVHGYLICIYHARPLLDYSITGVTRTNLKTTPTDYAIPEFDRTGMVSVPLVELSNSSSVSNFTGLLGYAPRYYEYKQAIDEVHGAFAGDLGSWVAPVSDSYISSYINGSGTNGINYQFFKVNPGTLNPIFALNADSSVSSDQLLVNASFDITAVRNLDRNGLPY